MGKYLDASTLQDSSELIFLRDINGLFSVLATLATQARSPCSSSLLGLTESEFFDAAGGGGIEHVHDAFVCGLHVGDDNDGVVCTESFYGVLEP